MKHVSIQKEISPGCSLEGLTLATSCERVDSLEKTHAVRDCGQEDKGMTEDEMPGWHHRLDGHEFE